jgi:D-cysteine desulfhydrase family pyridoxal phosphate-dependent enzyme
MTRQEWLRHIDTNFPRVPLATLPTPLEFAPNLSKQLDGPRIYFKRDDMTGLALGGDKPRKLEYLIAQALEQGADTVVTGGSSQSNQVRLTAAACHKVGLAPVALCTVDERSQNTGNLLITRLLGTEIHFKEVQDNDHWLLAPLMEQECERLRDQGRKPYLIPVSGTTTLACLGYFRCALELVQQFEEAELSPTALYITSGTGGNLAALSLGMALTEQTIRMVGINVNRTGPTVMEMGQRWLRDTAGLLGAEPVGGFEMDGRFVGDGYGIMTDACRDAIGLVARTEGLLLDPVYTGKTAAGLIAHISEGRLTPDDTVVFVHTGGIPALFAYADELVSY